MAWATCVLKNFMYRIFWTAKLWIYKHINSAPDFSLRQPGQSAGWHNPLVRQMALGFLGAEEREMIVITLW